MSIHRARHPKTAAVVHLIRVAMVSALLWLIPTQRPPVATSSDAAPAIDMKPLSHLGARTVGAVRDANGMWPVLDVEGTTVALIARTLPAAESAIGYRGPTEAAIVFDRHLNILSVELIDSADTPEHIAAVRKNESFFSQFRGWKWGGPPPAASIDGVSGATLTSLAMAKGIMIRIGGQRPSLVYPNGLDPQEISNWVSGEITIDVDDDQALLYDQHGEFQGRIIRSGPLSDQVVGYQGPTELLVWLSAQNRIVDLRIRESFDNDPYVGYVRTERSFWKHFKGQCLLSVWFDLVIFFGFFILKVMKKIEDIRILIDPNTSYMNNPHESYCGFS
ncbi:MAG: FMN-binding protein [Planctomycetaceae bacterium]